MNDDVDLSRAQISNIPYASIYARLGDSRRTLIVLSTIDGRALSWVSADHELIRTEEGLITKTVGLDHNLAHTQFVQSPRYISDFAISGEHSTKQEPRRFIDISPGHYSGLLLASELTRTKKRVPLIIAELTFTTDVIKEVCTIEDLGWVFTNTYWLSPETGFIWQSTQHISPKMPPLTISILKPAKLG